jgi:lipopolysaccharide export system protein LptA
MELSSDLLTLHLSTTNGPVRRIEAEHNVAVASPSDNSRATGQRAVYDEIAGTMELVGDPELIGSDYRIKGEVLVFNRTNGVFGARRNTQVQIPVSLLGQSSLLFPDPIVRQGSGTATNDILEVYADEFDYRTNRMDFRGGVHAQLVERNLKLKRGELTCADLTIRFGQRIESALASGGVTVRQFPSVLPDRRRVTRQFVCETLKAKMNSEGRLETVEAERNVRGEQTVISQKQLKPTRTRVVTDRLTARFAGQTNQVETIVAERNVTLEQEGRTAHGDHAVYHGDRQLLELTGQPTALSPEGRIIEADKLIWDAAQQQLRVHGQFKSAWQRLGRSGTNQATRASANSPGPSPPP